MVQGRNTEVSPARLAQLVLLLEFQNTDSAAAKSRGGDGLEG